jgi:hypothetical protein
MSGRAFQDGTYGFVKDFHAISRQGARCAARYGLAMDLKGLLVLCH